VERFANKIILVTGAASGIGRATAEQFAGEGGTVIATDLNEAALDEAFAALADDGLAVETAVQDVADPDQWQAVVGDIVDRHGRLDVLVNNAGGGHFATIEETTLEQWRYVNAVNLDGAFFGMQAGIAAMKEGGGAIVNVASIAANVAEPMLAAYSATKGGIAMLSKTAAVDCARRGYNIRINSIHPGYTDTKLVQKALASLGSDAEEFSATLMKTIPVGRLADPVEIARPILFLASDDASYMIGCELIVDGGYVAA
jgi:NAD(P)-dependent dehydrogenase (short-subunit alcohol dehydrogenase family)